MQLRTCSMMHFFSVSKLGQYFISENVMSEINVVSEITQGYSTKIVLFCFSLKKWDAAVVKICHNICKIITTLTQLWELLFCGFNEKRKNIASLFATKECLFEVQAPSFSASIMDYDSDAAWSLNPLAAIVSPPFVLSPLTRAFVCV